MSLPTEAEIFDRSRSLAARSDQRKGCFRRLPLMSLTLKKTKTTILWSLVAWIERPGLSCPVRSFGLRPLAVGLLPTPKHPTMARKKSSGTKGGFKCKSPFLVTASVLIITALHAPFCNRKVDIDEKVLNTIGKQPMWLTPTTNNFPVDSQPMRMNKSRETKANLQPIQKRMSVTVTCLALLQSFLAAVFFLTYICSLVWTTKYLDKLRKR